MEDNLQLVKLLAWLKATGRSKAWLARSVGYSYQQTHDKLSGRARLNDRFVVACFEGVEGLPADVFEAQGYVRGDGHVYKQIPLEARGGAA